MQLVSDWLPHGSEMQPVALAMALKVILSGNNALGSLLDLVSKCTGPQVGLCPSDRVSHSDPPSAGQ